MTAPTKTSRKLRKERKNRSKKVCLLVNICIPCTKAVLLSSVVPKSPRLRSLRRRASRRWACCTLFGLSSSLHCLPAFLTHAKAIHDCILLRMPALSLPSHEFYVHVDFMAYWIRRTMTQWLRSVSWLNICASVNVSPKSTCAYLYIWGLTEIMLDH